MDSIKEFLKKPKAEKITERGEMMKYFIEKINPGRSKGGFQPISMARMGRVLQGIPTKDLYYLRTICDDSEKRGFSFSKKFWWELNTKKHETNSTR